MAVKTYYCYICDRCKKEVNDGFGLTTVKLTVGDFAYTEKDLCDDCLEELGISKPKINNYDMEMMSKVPIKKQIKFCYQKLKKLF